MKKLILILAVALLPFVASAQTDTTKIKAHEEYCLVTASQKFLSKKVGINIKFKQTATPADEQVAEDAKKITFTSIVDALNYMAQQGWELVTAYSNPSDATTNYYIMRRPLS
jgi:hypothetical protein